MAEDPHRAAQDDGTTPTLSRSLEDEVRDPFSPIDGHPGPTRVRSAGPPPPAQSLLDALGRSASTVLTPDPPALGASLAPRPVPANRPEATSSTAGCTGADAPVAPHPSPAPARPPVGEQPPPAEHPPVVEEGGAPVGPGPAPTPSGASLAPASSGASLTSARPASSPPLPAAWTPPRPTGPDGSPVAAADPAGAAWLPSPPSTPTWVPPGARTGGEPTGWPAFGAPPPGPPSRRVLPIVMVAAVVMVLVVVAVALLGALGGDQPDTEEATDEPTSTTFPVAWDRRIAPIAEWVADERRLAFEHPVEVVLQTEEEYVARVAGDPAPADEEATQEADDAVASLRALGLIEGTVDLTSAAGDLSSEGTLAYYDPVDEMVFVRGDELTPAVRVTLAHELTHVLQDQHFDLERVGDPDFERAEELRAIVEGDAERIEDAYAAEVLTAAERTAYETESETDRTDGEAALADVPDVLDILFAAPYALGPGYLTYREQVDGGEPYDDALEDPPSQQELLDPSAQGTARAEPVEVEVEAPVGSEVLDEDTFDPLAWYMLLSSRGDAVAALAVVDGWGGDAYVSYRRGDQVCVAAAVTGDTPAAVDRLYFALVGWAAAGPEGAATVVLRGGNVVVHACDPGVGAATGAVDAVDAAILAVPRARAELEAGMISTGATSAQARCASTEFLGAFTLDELTNETADPARAQQEIEDAVAGCR